MSNEVGKTVSDEDIDFFRDNGYLRVPGFLATDELERLQAETAAVIEYALGDGRDEPGVFYAPSDSGAGQVLSRIEFMTHHSQACRWLMGNPDLLRMVERISGRDFLSIGESMVFKMPGEGAQVAWHRDHGSHWSGSPQNYNVDFYLDDASLETCLWAIPGSNLWPDEKANPFQRRDCLPSQVEQAVPLLMSAGDVLLHHDARLVHGSPTTHADSVRRTLYYWFYSLAALKPYAGSPDYQPRRWRYLHQCIEARKQSPYAGREVYYDYRAEVAGASLENEQVSNVYSDHGYWDPDRALPGSGKKRG